MGEEFEIEESPAEDMRAGVANASMQVMDAMTGRAADEILSFYHAACKLVEALVEGDSGLGVEHASQVMVSFAAGAAIDLVVAHADD